MADQAAAPRQQRPIAGNSTRGVAALGANHAAEDETSRNIGSACLPLRACRPSGGFVLGTLARVPAGVKQVSSSARRFKRIPMSTACGQRCGNDVHLWGGRCGAFWTLGRVWAGALWKPLVHPLFSLSDTRAGSSDQEHIDGYGELVVGTHDRSMRISTDERTGPTVTGGSGAAAD